MNLTFSVVIFVLRKGEDRVSNDCGNDFFCEISVLTPSPNPQIHNKWQKVSDTFRPFSWLQRWSTVFHQLLHFSPNVSLKKRPEKNLRNLNST